MSYPAGGGLIAVLIYSLYEGTPINPNYFLLLDNTPFLLLSGTPMLLL